MSSGALATTSGQKTGRSPKDKRVVHEEEFEKELWRGKYSPNYEMDDRYRREGQGACDTHTSIHIQTCRAGPVSGELKKYRGHQPL